LPLSTITGERDADRDEREWQHGVDARDEHHRAEKHQANGESAQKILISLFMG
jgi:hypothetical protein